MERQLSGMANVASVNQKAGEQAVTTMVQLVGRAAAPAVLAVGARGTWAGAGGLAWTQWRTLAFGGGALIICTYRRRVAGRPSHTPGVGHSQDSLSATSHSLCRTASTGLCMGCHAPRWRGSCSLAVPAPLPACWGSAAGQSPDLGSGSELEESNRWACTGRPLDSSRIPCPCGMRWSHRRAEC